MSSSRIDRIYCTQALFNKSDNWKIHDKPLFTDQSAVLVDISPRAQIKLGKAQWHMNVKRFDHPKFRGPVKQALKEGIISLLWAREGGVFTPNSPSAAQDLFDSMMNDVTLAAKKAQKAIARALGNCIHKYQRKVRFFEGLRRSPKTVKKLRTAKARLRAMELKDKEDREILIKARPIDIGPENAEFWTDRDAITSNRTIHGLRKPNGKVTRKPKKILQVAKDFYTDLFTQAKTNPKSQEALLKRLPSGNFTGSDVAVSTSEILTVVSNWTMGRVPGMDGIPQDFYKKFLKTKKGEFSFLDIITIICTILIETTKYRCKMPTRWSEGCIKIMYKKGDTTDISNYRPLSMTNTIYWSHQL